MRTRLHITVAAAAVTLAAGLIAPTVARATTVTVDASADTFVNSDHPATDEGSSPVARVNDGPSDKIALFKFTVTGIPAGESVASARFQVTTDESQKVTTAGEPEGETFNVSTVDNTWTESTTWSTRPPMGALIGHSDVPAEGGEPLAITLPAVSGNGIYSVAVSESKPTKNGDHLFATRENSSPAIRPQLVLDLTGPGTNTLLGNTAPVVNAGTDQTIVFPAGANMSGTVSDDGLPSGTVTTTWSTVSGPGEVFFPSLHSTTTAAAFPVAGQYVLALTADDGERATTDLVSVNASPGGVNTRPVVNAGPDKAVTLPAVLQLSGTASDDGQPSGTLTTIWSKTSGPGTVTFGTPDGLATSATFSVAGTYVLTLTASDGALSAADTTTVTVSPVTGGNSPPVVDAGPPQTVTLPATTAQLAGTATDDGQPSNTLTDTWSKTSGPGTVAFGNLHAAATSVTFSAVAGTYVLTLTATDGALTSTDTVTVTVQPAVTGAITVDAISDAGPTAAEWNNGLARAVVGDHPDLYLWAGDVRTSGTPAQWALWTQNYGALRNVTLPTPGNHDWTNHTTGYNVIFNGAPFVDTSTYCNAVTMGGWGFFSINSFNEGACLPKLTAWLKATPGTRKIVLTHEPRYSGGTHGSIAGQETIWAAMVGHALMLVSGHDHDAQIIENRGLVQLVNGCAGASYYPAAVIAGSIYHSTSAGDCTYTRLTLGATSARVEQVRATGVVAFTKTYTVTG